MNLKNFELIYLLIFAALTVTLILLKVFKVGNRRRGAVKMIASFMFVAAGAYGVFLTQSKYGALLIAGLIFAFAGDFLLVFMDKRVPFIAGIVSFGLASMSFAVYSVLAHGWRWWSLLIFAPVAAAFVFLRCKNILSYGDNAVYLDVYAVLVGICGIFGFSLLCSAATLSTAMFGLGCFLYMLSDACLAAYMFKFRLPAIDAVNSALYFSGMFLIAISLVL